MYKNDVDFLRRTAISSLTKISSPVSLYVHIPFCVRKCRYCDFLSGPVPSALRDRYLAALNRELKETGRLIGAVRVDSIFLGGGTPSLLTPGELDTLMSTVRAEYRVLPDAEITMECNPGTADAAKLGAYRELGINRISIGVQSFREEELRLLGRIHSADEARRCIEDAGRAGFSNINLDLMSALPGQSPEQWMESLREAVRLKPNHISAYSLILEEGTEFWDMSRREGELPPFPDDETDRFMYHETKRFLAEHGYERYEISNYARAGFESRHNNGYWTGHAYLGFGAGAASYLGDVRWNHVRNLETYCRGVEASECSVLQEIEHLTRKDRMAEFMFLGLRRMEGVSEEEFGERFGAELSDVYGPVVRKYLEWNLLEKCGGRVRLTDRGIDISNRIMADFL